MIKIDSQKVLNGYVRPYFGEKLDMPLMETYHNLCNINLKNENFSIALNEDFDDLDDDIDDSDEEIHNNISVAAVDSMRANGWKGVFDFYILIVNPAEKISASTANIIYTDATNSSQKAKIPSSAANKGIIGIYPIMHISSDGNLIETPTENSKSYAILPDDEFSKVTKYLPIVEVKPTLIDEESDASTTKIYHIYPLLHRRYGEYTLHTNNDVFTDRDCVTAVTLMYYYDLSAHKFLAADDSNDPLMRYVLEVSIHAINNKTAKSTVSMPGEGDKIRYVSLRTLNGAFGVFADSLTGKILEPNDKNTLVYHNSETVYANKHTGKNMAIKYAYFGGNAQAFYNNFNDVRNSQDESFTAANYMPYNSYRGFIQQCADSTNANLAVKTGSSGRFSSHAAPDNLLSTCVTVNAKSIITKFIRKNTSKNPYEFYTLDNVVINAESVYDDKYVAGSDDISMDFLLNNGCSANCWLTDGTLLKDSKSDYILTSMNEEDGLFWPTSAFLFFKEEKTLNKCALVGVSSYANIDMCEKGFTHHHKAFNVFNFESKKYIFKMDTDADLRRLPTMFNTKLGYLTLYKQDTFARNSSLSDILIFGWSNHHDKQFKPRTDVLIDDQGRQMSYTECTDNANIFCILDIAKNMVLPIKFVASHIVPDTHQETNRPAVHIIFCEPMTIDQWMKVLDTFFQDAHAAFNMIKSPLEKNITELEDLVFSLKRLKLKKFDLNAIANKSDVPDDLSLSESIAMTRADYLKFRSNYLVEDFDDLDDDETDETDDSIHDEVKQEFFKIYRTTGKEFKIDPAAKEFLIKHTPCDFGNETDMLIPDDWIVNCIDNDPILAANPTWTSISPAPSERDKMIKDADCYQTFFALYDEMWNTALHMKEDRNFDRIKNVNPLVVAYYDIAKNKFICLCALRLADIQKNETYKVTMSTDFSKTVAALCGWWYNEDTQEYSHPGIFVVGFPIINYMKHDGSMLISGNSKMYPVLDQYKNDLYWPENSYTMLSFEGPRNNISHDREIDLPIYTFDESGKKSYIDNILTVAHVCDLSIFEDTRKKRVQLSSGYSRSRFPNMLTETGEFVFPSFLCKTHALANGSTIANISVSRFFGRFGRRDYTQWENLASTLNFKTLFVSTTVSKNRSDSSEYAAERMNIAPMTPPVDFLFGDFTEEAVRYFPLKSMIFTTYNMSNGSDFESTVRSLYTQYARLGHHDNTINKHISRYENSNNVPKIDYNTDFSTIDINKLFTPEDLAEIERIYTRCVLLAVCPDDNVLRNSGRLKTSDQSVTFLGMGMTFVIFDLSNYEFRPLPALAWIPARMANIYADNGIAVWSDEYKKTSWHSHKDWTKVMEDAANNPTRYKVSANRFKCFQH